MELDTINIDMHNDGSPLGNARLSDRTIREHLDQASCPDKKCRSWPTWFKCYSSTGHLKCNTYRKRNKGKLFLRKLLDSLNSYLNPSHQDS
jgi:hypothetical protein